MNVFVAKEHNVRIIFNKQRFIISMNTVIKQQTDFNVLFMILMKCALCQ